MAQIFYITLSAVILFSCQNVEDSNLDSDFQVLDNRTELAKKLHGKWIDKEDSTSLWLFNDSLVKWNGFAQTLQYHNVYFEVGSIRFNVKETKEGLVLTNQTSKQKHRLIRENF